MESAEGVLDVMKESKLEPLSDTFTILASGYAKKGDIEKVVEIFDTCEGKEIYFSDKEYLDVVYSLAINGHGDKVDQVNKFVNCFLSTIFRIIVLNFVEIQVLKCIQKTSGYNQDAINCILKLLTAGQEEVAFKVFDTMTKPLKFDGTSPPIGRFLIGHLTKINSVKKTISIFL